MLSSLHARLGLSSKFSLETLSQCLTTKTPATTSKNNRSLAILGGSFLKQHCTRHVLLTYPRLPEPVMRETVGAYTRETSMTELGRSWGVKTSPNAVGASTGAIVYQTEATDVTEEARHGKQARESTAYEAFVQAVVGGIYLHDGEEAARAFVDRHVLSRSVEIMKQFKYKEPQRQLSLLCRREGLEAPVNRLIAETGRMTNTPIFVIGVYSGSNKLGEGQGTSLVEAEYKAQTAALKGWSTFKNPETGPDGVLVIDHGDLIV